MLNCFAHASGQAGIPIIPLKEKQLSVWAERQTQYVKNWLKSTGYRAKAGAIGLICNSEGLLETVLVGLNHAEDWNVFGQLATQLPEGVYFIAESLPPRALYLAYLAFGAGSYQFTPYKKATPSGAKLLLPKQDLNIAWLEAVLRATYLVRDLINTPAEDMTPLDLAAVAVGLANEFGGVARVIEGDELLTHNFPAIHAVGRASRHVPCLIDFTWGNVKHPKVTLVGKGISFDTGGLNLKNAAGMALMKKDMGGAAHVLGLAVIIMTLGLPVRLRVLIPAAENAVSGAAYHPGDVLMTRKGITVEVTNTDAEGRLVLSDALQAAVEETPELLMDFATLTGASKVALGTDIAGLYCNDDLLAQEIVGCGDAENDPVWRMPLYAPYRKMLDSKIADIINAPSSGYAGAITAALFLKEFVPDSIPWGHFDIMAWNVSSKPAAPEGGETSALRAVAQYLYQRYKS